MRSKFATLAVAAVAAAGIGSASGHAAETDIVETAIAAGQFKSGLRVTLECRSRRDGTIRGHRAG